MQYWLHAQQMKSHHHKAAAVMVTAATLTAAVPILQGKKEEDKKTCSWIKHERRSVEQIYCSPGLIHFHCAFWMDYDQFCLLHHKLEAKMDKVMSQFYAWKGGRKAGNYVPPTVQNGAITNMTIIAYALQYSFGKSSYDLMANYNISCPEVMKSQPEWYC